MKKSIFLIFAAILCSVSAWAHNLAADSYVYFEKPSDWEAAQLLLGKSNWSEGYTMTKISNTNLYYLKTIKWDGYTEYYFFEKKDKWGGEGNSPTNRIPWAGKTSSKYTSAIAKCHLFNSTKSIKSSTTATAYATVVNRIQTIKVQLKDGSNWVDATVVPADLTASTYALTSEKAAGAQSASLAKESTTVSATVSAAYSATVSLSCTNVLDGYVFEGWYDANGNKITSYTVSDAHTVYARFIQSAEETNEVTVTYMCGTTSVATAVNEYVGVDTEKSFTAPTVTGYKFTKWTIGAGMTLKTGADTDATIGVVTKSASSDYTLVANYEEVLETVYFINTIKWARVNIHKWNGKAAASSWPGEKLTASGEKIGEYDVYSYTAKQGDYANIIFNSKTSGTDGGNAQTADLTWTAGKYYIYNYGGKSDWYTKEDAEALLVAPVVEETVYFVNNKKWTKVQAYAWNATGNNSWPGVALTPTGEKVADFDVYSYTAPQGYVNVIFNNKTGDSGEQSADFVWTNGKYYYMGADKDYAGGTKEDVATALATPVPTYDYYVIGTINSWTLEDAAYGMTDENADGVYEKEVTLADGKNQMKINNGTWDNASTFGYDQLDAKYEGVSRGKDGDDNNIIIDITPGKDITIKFDKNANKITLDGLTKIEDYYTVVGVAELFGTAWDRANETNKMAKQGDGSYKLVKENVTLAAIGYDWKIAKNGDWWNDAATGVNPSEGNNTLTITTAGRYNVTFTLAADLKSATVETELLEAAVVIPDCYISGNATLTGGEGWQGNEFTMVYDEETETWSYTLAGLQPEKAYELKVVCGGTWYSYANLTSVPTGVTEGNDHSIAFKMAAAGDVVVTYNVEAGITLSGNFAVPTPATYTVVGHKDILGESWNLASTINIMTETDGNYTLTKTGLKLEARDYEYKVVKNGAYGEGEYPNGTNEKVTIAENGVYTIVYTYKVGTSLEAVATKTGDYTPDKATYTVAGDIALCGTNWKADDETNDMTDNGDGTFTWAKTGIELVTNVSFKVVKNHDFEIASYPSNNWVIDIEGSNGVYDITITFTESNQEIKVEKTRTGDLPKKTLVYTVTVPAGTKQCYIAGVMNEWTAQPMTPAGTNKFSISIDNVTIATGYKYTCKDGEDTWAYVEKKNGNVGVDNRTYNANDVVERWNRIDISDGENAAIIGSHAGKGEVEVYVDRELKAGQLYTISLPFAVADADGLFGSETEVYEYADLKYENDEYALYFDNTKNAMEAGKPYLVKPGSDRNGFEYKNTDVVFEQKVISKTVNNTTISMESVLSVTAGATTNGKYWLASDNCLYNVSTALKSLRAVFDIQSTKANVRARVAFGENVETGVDNIVTTDAPVKVIKNGQLIIIRDGVKYNVQGQKL